MTAPIEKKKYDRIHKWLNYHYGKATECENPNCEGKSKYYTWALLKRKKYENKRENFWQLCRSCHAKYDMTEESKRKIREAHRGKKHSKEHKKKISITTKKFYANGGEHPRSMLGKKHSEKTKKKMSKARKGIVYSEETLKRMSIAHKGKPNGCLGTKRSEESKKRMREAQRRRRIQI